MDIIQYNRELGVLCCNEIIKLARANEQLMEKIKVCDEILNHMECQHSYEANFEMNCNLLNLSYEDLELLRCQWKRTYTYNQHLIENQEELKEILKRREDYKENE